MIELWDGYEITADEFQYILSKPAKYKYADGQPYIKMLDQTFHKTMSQALLSYYQKQVRQSMPDGAESLKTFIERAESIEKRIRQLVQEADFDDLRKPAPDALHERGSL